ncbi:MAG: NUDIX hydrolase [Rhodosalinus sp.]|uniref:NUDIX hydrolase n=1 Tax=Rhodosalinus sp. TaxID=2047741 RepID=UPI00397DA0DC
MTRPPGDNWSGFSDAAAAGTLHRQVAALCYRGSDADREVLLITSRGTGRWVLPKGWPIAGLDAPGSARQEAWEEAGVIAADSPMVPLGQYRYVKRNRHMPDLLVEVQVFALEVARLADRFPEEQERRRAWMSPARAAKVVAEPDLAALIAAF